MTCSNLKKNNMIQSIMEIPNPIITHVMVVDVLENKEFVGKHNNHHNQHQIMKIIYQRSQAHNNLDHQVETH